MGPEINWTNCLLGDVVNLKRGYDLPKRDRVDGAYPIVSSSGVTGSHNVAMVKGPGVVTGRYGTLGQVFYVRSDFWPLNTSLYVQDFKGNNPLFICYLLKTLNLGIRSAAAAVPGVNRNHLHALLIKKPHLNAQHKISSILSAYDDLIENNTRRIAILEEMAQMIYGEWFVKFRFPGHEKVKMVDSPLGKMPEGWEIKTLSDVCVYMYSGGTPSRKNHLFWDEGTIDWYKTRELWDGFLFKSEEKITEEGLEGSSAKMFKKGTILMAIYGAPTVGRLGILNKSGACNQAAIGFNADETKISQLYLYYQLFGCREYFNSIAQGAAQQNISKEKVGKTKCLVPLKSAMDNFTSLVTPVWKEIENLSLKQGNLRQTRDFLLPKLISGELDVSDLDIKIPEIDEPELQASAGGMK
jgi:type I restriction enzyme, S subunit